MRVKPTMEFLSSLGKVVSKKALSLDPSDDIYFEQRKFRPRE